MNAATTGDEGYLPLGAFPKQAGIVAMKHVTGHTVVLLLGTVLLVLVLPYKKDETT